MDVFTASHQRILRPAPGHRRARPRVRL